MIKEVLKKICNEIIELNNKPFAEDQVISNHIFDEKGVQMYLGWELTKKLGLYDEKHKLKNLQFEKKIINEEIGKKDYLDILLFYKGKKIGIELKFKTKGIHIKKKPKATQERKEKFKYYFSNQGAETNGHHSFFWDLHRLNKFISDEEIHLGYQIFITNDSSYWKKKKKGNAKGYIIVNQNGKAEISETETKNNSHIFKMSHDTPFPLDKKMDAPNWLSVDSIKGQKVGRKKLVENLDKKIKQQKFLYCQNPIDLNHIVDDKIEWLPQKIEHLGEKQDNPARSKIEENTKFNLIANDDQQAITKFAFIIIELEKKS
jgi:hypothetical protein